MILSKTINKNKRHIAFVFVLIIFISCKYKHDQSSSNKKNEFMITKEKAIEIANHNASLYYRDLSIYEMKVQLVDSNWKVDYELKDNKLDGGGPHYIISGKSGKIIESHFYQ